jgi:hypothetical protein
MERITVFFSQSQFEYLSLVSLKLSELFVGDFLFSEYLMYGGSAAHEHICLVKEYLQ